MALMTIEVDQPIDEAVLKELSSLSHITQVTQNHRLKN